MRITGGKARGVPLQVGKVDSLRPATDRMRESVFSSLGERVEGARVLDLFAGTGAYGLEALSRGALAVTFVEKDRRAMDVLKRNAAAVEKSLNRNDAMIQMTTTDVLKWRTAGVFDLIFMDPPYAEIQRMAAHLFRMGDAILSRTGSGRLLFEMPGEMEIIPPGWDLIRRMGKGRGQPTICIYARCEEATPFDAQT